MLKDEQMLNSLQLLRQQYLCPISRQVMRNPVIDCQGVSYEKIHIQKWFQSNNISPVTGSQMSSKSLIQNYYLQDLFNKVQAQIPKILSVHQLLKNQIHSLKLENQKLLNQQDLNPQNQLFQTHFQNYEEQMVDQQDRNQKLISNQNINSMVIHETKKLSHLQSLQSNFNSIKNHSSNKNQEKNKKNEGNKDQQNQENIMSYLQKRKFIKKLNFERFYSNKVSQNLKTMKKDWQKHLQNVTFSNKQMIKKYKKSLKQKEQQLQKYKQTINQQSFKQSQLNNNLTNKYQLSQSNQNQILHKIQELKMQLKAYILNKYYPLPENVKDKSYYQNSIQNQIKKAVVNLQRKDQNYDQSLLRNTEEKQMNNKLRSQIKGYQLEMGKLLDQIYKSKKQLQSYKKIADQQKFALNVNHKKQISKSFKIIKQKNLNIQNLKAQIKRKIQKKTSFYSKKYIRLIPTNNQTPPPKNQSNLPEKQRQQILLQFKQNHKIWTIIFFIYAKQVKKLDLIDDKFKKILDEQGQNYHNEIYESRIFNKKLTLIWKTLQNGSVKSLLQTFRVYDKQINKMIDYGYEIQAGSLWQILQRLNERETYWRQILCISSVNFTIDNGEWRVLVRNGYLYPNLIEINLVGCEIEDVEWKDFSRWEGLRRVSFEGNPLSGKSRDQLKEYKKCNPNVQVIF